MFGGCFYRSDAMRFVFVFALVGAGAVFVWGEVDVAPLVVARMGNGACVDRGPVALRALCVGNAARPVAVL